MGAVAVAGLSGCRAPARGPGRVQLSDVGGYVEMVTRQRERRQRPKERGDDTITKETTYEENLRLETEGYVYHPNLLEFTLGGLFGLLQEDYEDRVGETTRSSSDNGEVYEFDLEALFLKKKKHPTTVFAHRRRDTVPRPFLPSLETITTEYGFIWQYVSDKTPAKLQFSHTDVRLSPLFLSGDTAEDGRREDTELRFEIGYNFSEFNTLLFTYDRESLKEAPYELEYDSDELTLEHRWEFGDHQQHRLDSELNYFDQWGTLELERLRWRQELWLQHSDTLRSMFRLEALDRTRGNRTRDLPSTQERSVYLSGSLQHRLYESLTSQFLTYVRSQKFEPGLEIEQFGAQASFSYRKKNAWGVLNANYAVRAERSDHRGDVQAADVVDEYHVFRDPDPIVLGNPNIDSGSILIKSENRATFYQPGRDYTVRTLGDRIELERVPTGQISDGDTVLIDYVYTIGGTFTLDSVSQSFGIRQAFSFGLTPYYRLEWQDQTISPTQSTGAVADDITAHILGVEFERWSMRWFAEYEDRESTINPFEATRLGASYSHRFRSGASGSVRARWSDTAHRPPNEREVSLFTLDGRYRHPITANLTVEGAATYRLGEDSLAANNEGIDLYFALEWVVRQTEVKVTLELGDFETDFSRNDSSALHVQMRRRF